jgi:hypothetical protein
MEAVLEKKTVKNAVPKRYRIYHITPGIADYTAEGIGRVLIQKAVLDKMNPSFVGKPVVNMQHTDKEPDELFQSLKNGSPPEEFADGVISAVGYDEASGWYYTDALIWDTETQENIDNGFSASCAYDVTDFDDKGGTYNNVEYDEEVLDGEYVHMAIVPNPRYERAYIIKNSKGEEMKITLFKNKGEKKPIKNQEPPPKKPDDEDEEVIENADGYVEIDGEQVPLAELIKVYQGEQAGGETMLNEDDEVDTGDGKRVRVGDMINAYRNRKKNADEEIQNEAELLDEPAEEVVDETKQMSNSKSSDKKPKKNENFKKVENAAERGNPGAPEINTQTSRLSRGKARYGTPVKQGGNA